MQRQRGQQGRMRENVQNDKFPDVFFFIDVRSTFNIQKNEELHSTVILFKSRCMPCRL